MRTTRLILQFVLQFSCSFVNCKESAKTYWFKVSYTVKYMLTGIL